MDNNQWDFSFDDILSGFGIENTEEPQETESIDAYPEEQAYSSNETAGNDYEEPAVETMGEPQYGRDYFDFGNEEQNAVFAYDEEEYLPRTKRNATPKSRRSHADTSKEDAARAKKEQKIRARELEKEEKIRARENEKAEKIADKERERFEREQEKQMVARFKSQEKAARLAATVHERRKGKIAAAIFGLIFAAIAAAILIGGNKVSKSIYNLPNVYINNVFVGSMTKEQAEQALLSSGWQDRTGENLVVKTFEDVSFEVNPIEAGVLLDLSSAVEAAYRYGHDGNIIRNLYTYCENFVTPIDINEENTTVNYEYIDGKIAEGEERLNAILGTEEYSLDLQNSMLTMRKGFDSMKLNTAELFDSIVKALKNGDTSEMMFTQLSKDPVMPDFETIHTELEAEPVDARYSDDGLFDVVDETVGCKFSIPDAQAIWTNAQPGQKIEIPVSVTWPSITGEKLRNQLFHDMLGAMTTRYTNSGENRCSNLRLGASKINGIILYPGDEFSFNNVVGERTAEAGFLPAPAYAGTGEDGVKDEIGGGSCQVSSTLYAATVFAFLETVERHNHIYPVNYIQLGTDATVTIPEEGTVMDFKFKNNKNYPIKIVGYTNESEEEKSITFEIWGTLEPDDYMPVEFDNTYSWTFDYDRFIDPAYSDREGYKIKLTIADDLYSGSDEIGPFKRTLTHRQVFNSAGERLVDEIINPLIPSGHAMDTYYQHP